MTVRVMSDADRIRRAAERQHDEIVRNGLRNMYWLGVAVGSIATFVVTRRQWR